MIEDTTSIDMKYEIKPREDGEYDDTKCFSELLGKSLLFLSVRFLPNFQKRNTLPI